MGSSDVLSMDYVYDHPEEGGFKCVHVNLSPNASGNYFDMVLTSAEKIETATLGNILNALWSDMLAKLNISLYDDCKVKLAVGDAVYDVVLSQAVQIAVDALILL